MATKKLTDSQRNRLDGTLHNAHWPNEVRWEASTAFTTPGGREAAAHKWDRKLVTYLVDAGLIEFVRAEGYTFNGDYPSAGFYRVTDAGKAALETGRYEAEGKAPAGERRVGWGNVRGDRDERPIASPIALFTGYSDAGPCEAGSPSAFCPHCGSGGRYVWGFVCENGEKRGAMRGCLKLFRASRLATDQMAAFDRVRKAEDEKRKPASWDEEILDATDRLKHDQIGIGEAKSIITAALERRRAWLRRRGYGRRVFV